MAIWISWNINILRSLNSRDSFPKRKFLNRAQTSCRPGPIRSLPTIRFELHAKMAEERPRIVQFLELQKPWDLDLDLRSDRGHTGAHIRSRSTHTPNYIQIGNTSCGRTEVHTYRQTHPELTKSNTRNVGQCPTRWPPCQIWMAPPVQRRKVWLTLTTTVPCSNAAKMRNPLKFAWGSPNLPTDLSR